MCVMYLTSYYEVGVWKQVLGLHEGTSVSRVEQVKDAIGVHSDWAVHCKAGGATAAQALSEAFNTCKQE